MKGLFKASPRIARLSVRLLDYKYEVRYVPGFKNKIADYLSRMPLARTDEEVKELEDCCVADIIQDVQGITEDEWNKGLDNDVILSKVQMWLCEGWPHKKNLDDDIRVFWKVKEELSVEGNRLMRNGRYQLQRFIYCCVTG
ncbi:hypothetical protein NDU88_007789 [Pleurodeles waltl]|uniref:Uncharacterized protein n=1 Tax=Pleurodeles waltl TaxID=8319 RepID=A0AAV7PNK5_PLEWA|nr:hypothetical protein NDU88_007789 [Pleurodeles waltl]